MTIAATTYWAEKVFLGDRWAEKVSLQISDDGFIQAIMEDTVPIGNRLEGPVIPAMPNLHSHAFQRAMAGLAEKASGEDDFWTWRQEMYRLANHINPDLYLPLARYLYVEMLEAGYGAVAEFHYLHAGAPLEMAQAIIQAAAEAGIGLTLLPVFYAHADFGGKPPTEGQKRFLLSLEDYSRLYQNLSENQGLAFHSLRAATIEEIKELLPLAEAETPIHIHIAEQEKEVQASLAFSGQRPIAYLDSHVDLNSRWCFVHATHADDEELALLARRSIVAGLCPSTEGNLGDGFFDSLSYLALGGHWGIGTDSHVTLDPAAELRTLEYHQRLRHRKRNLLHGTNQDVAAYLFSKALSGGAQALGQKIGRLAQGSRADMLVLDNNDPMIGMAKTQDVLARALFACRTLPVKDVMVKGRWVVKGGRHIMRERAQKEFKAVLAQLY